MQRVWRNLGLATALTFVVGCGKERTDVSKTFTPPTGTANHAKSLAVEALYTDRFDNVTGGVRRRSNDKTMPLEGDNTRTNLFSIVKLEHGTLTLRSTESAVTIGPDGKPGVLAFTWDELPPAVQFSSFIYLGRANEPIELKPLVQARKRADLGGLRLSFRYRGESAQNKGPMQLKVKCRLEPGLPDSYLKRLDLGELIATEQWQTFDVTFVESSNIPAFLYAMATESPAKFMLLWCQAGVINNYRAGDTLLIDDIQFTHEK